MVCLGCFSGSPIWEGIFWPCKAARMVINWKLGNGRSVRVLEDHWLGTCALVIQHWDLCVGELKKSVYSRDMIVSIWNSHLVDLFHKSRWICVLIYCLANVNLMQLFGILILQAVFLSNFYTWPLNFRDVMPLYLPSVWKLNIPGNWHVFVWLVAKNKTLNIENFNKKKKSWGSILFWTWICVACAF
jgi:hypothetical protein